MGGTVANIVIEEYLDGVLVVRIQQQQLPRPAALVAALPEGIVVPNCVCPAATTISGHVPEVLAIFTQFHERIQMVPSVHTPQKSCLLSVSIASFINAVFTLPQETIRESII